MRILVVSPSTRNYWIKVPGAKIKIGPDRKDGPLLVVRMPRMCQLGLRCEIQI